MQCVSGAMHTRFSLISVGWCDMATFDMGSENKKTAAVTMRVAPELHKAIRIVAALEGVSSSKLCEKFVRKSIQNFSKNRPEIFNLIKNGL